MTTYDRTHAPTRAGDPECKRPIRGLYNSRGPRAIAVPAGLESHWLAVLSCAPLPAAPCGVHARRRALRCARRRQLAVEGWAPSSPSWARISIRRPMRRGARPLPRRIRPDQGPGPPSVVSVKPTQLGLDLSIDACAAHVETAVKAESVGSILWIDMENSSYRPDARPVSRRQVAARRSGWRSRPISAGLRRTSSAAAAPTDHPAGEGRDAEPAQVAFPAKADTDLAFYQLPFPAPGRRSQWPCRSSAPTTCAW
jgi:hypothetical protein